MISKYSVASPGLVPNSSFTSYLNELGQSPSCLGSVFCVVFFFNQQKVKRDSCLTHF